MAPAVGHVAELARSVSVHDPRTRGDLQPRRPGRPRRPRGAQAIVEQIASPVRWDLCLDTMPDLGVTGILEMPPAGTLTGIAKRALPGVETFALKSPDQLDDARAFCEARRAVADGHHPTWRMLVSPAKGTFNRTAPARRRLPASGAAIGASPAARPDCWRRARRPIVEWLVEDGDLVSPGQPLVRLHPEGV